MCLAASASTAAAVTLSIKVPRRVHKGQKYTVTISGSFDSDKLTAWPYLIAAFQFSRQPCQKTAQLENNLPHQPQFYLESGSTQAGIFERHSPFTRSDQFRARVLGPRHVCAWLYPEFVGPQDTVAPIATADAAYTVLRRR